MVGERQPTVVVPRAATTIRVVAVLLYLPAWATSRIIRWLLLKEGQWRAAAWVGLLPLVNVAAAGAALALISIICDGELVCKVF